LYFSPKRSNKTNRTAWLISFICLFALVWANSLIGTTDMINWLIENTLTAVALLFLIATYRKYRFSTFSYLLICIFLCLHVYGSKYTYAENPLGFWLQDIFDSPRNHYDRLVHFSFGFLLYFPLWECFSKWLKYPSRIAVFLAVTVILSVSGIYEIIEWLVADVFFAEQGQSYLGTQGDIWDAQKDMAIALVGVAIATLLFYLFRILSPENVTNNTLRRN
jgi:putative membrane protein